MGPNLQGILGGRGNAHALKVRQVVAVNDGGVTSATTCSQTKGRSQR